MPNLSKFAYWTASAAGITAWTGAIVGLSSLPLPTQLALGAMGAVGAAWGHAVFFPKPRPSGEVAAPGRASREEVLATMLPAQRPAGGARRPVVGRASTPAELAAREEARRLSETLTAIGLFGPVLVRIEADGTAVIAPVREGEAVRVPAHLLTSFAARAVTSDGHVAEALQGSGQWPGEALPRALAYYTAALEAAGRPAPQAEPEAARLWREANGLLGGQPRGA